MLSDSQQSFVRTAARTLQIIVAALAVGVLTFMGAVLFVVQAPAQPPPTTPVITYAAMGMAAVVIIMRLILPGIVVRSGRNALIAGRSVNSGMRTSLPNTAELGDVAQLAAVYQTRTIIATALLEGAAFFSIVAYMLERQPVALYLAGVLLVLILGHMPTASRLGAWIENQLTEIRQLRQLR